MKKVTITLLAAIVLLLMMKDNIHAQIAYGLFPGGEEGNVVSFVKNEISGAWEYSGIAGSTEIQINYGFARNPVDGEYYLIASDAWGYLEPPAPRYLYHLNSSTFGIEEPPVALLVSSNGDTKPNAFAISSNGEFFIAYSNGRIDKFDINTLQSTTHANVDPGGGMGLTYDFDNDRLLYTKNTDLYYEPISLYEVTNGGFVNPLFEFSIPGANDCSAQAIAYLGEGVCLASSTYGCDILYTIDLNFQTTELIAQPNGSWDSLKSFMFVPSAPLNVDILYVTETGAGDKDGSSWDHAFEGLQDALDAAEPGEQIWVAAGTYTPTTEVGGQGDKYKSFQMINGVAIYGGFAGDEASLTERVIKDNPTILSGDLLGDDDYSEFPGVYLSDNALHVIYLEGNLGLDKTAILDGFIVQGGSAFQGAKDGESQGGGIFISNNSPLIRNCVFRYNSAVSGGAVYVEGYEFDVVFTNCIIANNFSEYEGGGISVDIGVSLTLTNTTIAYNYTAGDGGGIFSWQSYITLNNSILWGNTAEGAGNQISIIYGSKNDYEFMMNYSCYSAGENDIHDNQGYIDVYNCITDDPLFVNPSNGDYRIYGTSPCVDAGDNQYNDEPYDIRGAGFLRILAQDDVKVARIDMGAYEFKNGTDPDAPIIFVDLDRPDDSGDGFSWTFAKKTLQAAIDIAGSGYQIWVKTGTYTPADGDIKNIDNSFLMKNRVAIYGGFAGNEESISERAIQDNPTILSGDLNGDDNYSLLPWQNMEENSYHVIIAMSCEQGNTSILDGFIIQGGNASLSQAAPSGGGIFVVNYSPLIRNCVFRNNLAPAGGAVGVGYSEMVFTNCIISNNISELRGGGLSVKEANITLNNTTIADNYTEGDGGGIYAFNSDITVNNSIIWDNEAGDDGNQISVFEVVKNGYGFGMNYSCYSDGIGDIADYGEEIEFINCITDDPLFVDPENGDYRIFGISPCVDAGNDDYNNLLYDIRGAGFDRKIMNSKGEGIDMGAYEYNNPLNDPYDPCTVNYGGEIGEDQTIFYNTQPELLFSIASPSGYYGTLQYKWQLSTVTPTVWTDIEISGTHTNTYQPDVLTQTTWFRRLARVGCATPTWENAAESNPVKITVIGWPYPWEKCNTSPAANGTSSYNPELNGGTFQLAATGQSTTLNDVYHFVYQDICESKATVIARLADIENGGWAGVMMRESCSPGAKTILFKTRLYNPNVFIGFRTIDNKAMRNASQVAQLIHWMKIQRNGTNFKVFTSYNGTTWQQRYSVNISMGSCIQAGIFTESVLATRTSVAWFDHAEVYEGLKSGDDLLSVDTYQNSGNPLIELYPNPADDLVTINIAGNESEVSYSITDLDGRVIVKSGFTGSETVLDVSDFKPGLYVIRIEIGGEIVTKRLVVM